MSQKTCYSKNLYLSYNMDLYILERENESHFSFIRLIEMFGQSEDSTPQKCSS